MRVIGLLLAGVFWWSLLEYLLHRFAFHMKGPLFGKRHLAHHANLQKKRLAVAPWQSMVGGAALHWLVLWPLLGVASTAIFFVGFIGGYAAYEWVHFATHYVVPKTAVGRYLRAYHLAHHHRTPKARFGVTSPLWDVVFGTYAPVPKGKAPVKVAVG
jgi:sterol desaturase/sphingolipid hydroxylase (fatty acid hydroxylase superfamily)